MPAGLAAIIKEVSGDRTTMTVTFSGIPTQARTAAMTLEIPVASLVNGAAVLVFENANAKWDIIAPTVTSVTVSPATASVVKEESEEFTATVTGTNNPNETVTWTVEGASSTSTTITPGGVLSVGIDETAAVLTVRATSVVDEEKSGTAAVTVTTPPDPDDDDPTSPVTVYNGSAKSNATMWLTSVGLNSGDLLITRRNPQGSAYDALMRLADSKDVVAIYNIYLRSGARSTGYSMNLTFNLNKEFAGQSFTLVHQKADATYEYFYDAADSNGKLDFGPLYELSPFMLVNGTLAPTPAPDAPQTGDSAPLALLLGVMLMAAAACTGLVFYRRRVNQR